MRLLFIAIVFILGAQHTLAQYIAEEFIDARIEIDSTEPSIVKAESIHNSESERKGYKLIGIEPGSYFSQDGYPKRRIVSQDFHGDTLIVKASIIANCCSSFEGELEVLNDTTLNLLYTEFGTECFCGGCWFYLQFKILTTNKGVNAFYLNDYPIFKSDSLYRAVSEEKTYYENGKPKLYAMYVGGELYYKIIYKEEGGRGTTVFRNHVLTSTYDTPKMNKEVNREAKAYGQVQLTINAPIKEVYEALADIKQWPDWQKNTKSVSIEGEVEEGMEFEWKAKGVRIKSKLHTARPYTAFGWTGKILWITATHNWSFYENDGQTIVIVEESLEGFLAGWGKKTMLKDMKQSLGELKVLVEGR